VTEPDLGELDRQAEAARQRHITRRGVGPSRVGVPNPRRPVTGTTSSASSGPAATDLGGTTLTGSPSTFPPPAAVSATPPPETTTVPDPRLAGGRTPRPAPEPVGDPNPLAPATISLDQRTEELLEAVRTAGRFARPRVDANRSATIRLAMALLGEQYTPAQVVEQLRRRTPPGTTTGRKRLA
jgi:hypothetical protein